MPQVFKVGAYVVYFWIGEGEPLEPVHVHITEGVPGVNGTKCWLTRSGKVLVANNASKIPKSTLRKIIRMIEANADHICRKWLEYFGELTFYC